MMPLSANWIVSHTELRRIRVTAIACRDISAKVMVTPALTAARMPEAWTCSASRYEPNGISQLTRICEPVSLPQTFVTPALARVRDSVHATPVASPAHAPRRKLGDAAPAETVPGTGT